MPRKVVSAGLIFLLRTSAVAEAYDRPIHFSMTMFLAETAGFSEAEAFEIARFDQATDDDPATDPMAILNVAARRDFHFALTDRIRTLRLAALAACGPKPLDEPAYKAIGRFAHAFQDSFSHRDHMWIGAPIFGHALPGHNPDQPWIDAASFQQMFSATFDELVVIRGRCGNAAVASDVVRQRFDDAKAKVDAWKAAEVDIGEGDNVAPERWNAFLPRLYGTRFETYTVQYLTTYAQWAKTAWR